MISRGSPWQRHEDRRTSKDNAERRASMAFFIIQRQLNLHFDQGQYHVFFCNIQLMSRIIVKIDVIP